MWRVLLRSGEGGRRAGFSGSGRAPVDEWGLDGWGELLEVAAGEVVRVGRIRDESRDLPARG